jgi:lipoprotein-anchoring transpeptidase ErfK/SrfK
MRTNRRRRSRGPTRQAGLAFATGLLALAAVLSECGRTPTEPAAPGPGKTTASTQQRPPAARGVPPRLQTAADTANDRCRSTSDRTILVDLSQQQLWLCAHGHTVASTPVTTGNDSSSTPTGSWHVYAKQRHRWLSGRGYAYLASYWMPFHAAYGFHDSPWQTMPYGSQAYHAQGSHGCIHLPLRAMRQLFAWAAVGTSVRVVP